MTIDLHIDITGDATALRDRALWESVIDQQLTPALKERLSAKRRHWADGPYCVTADADGLIVHTPWTAAQQAAGIQE